MESPGPLGAASSQSLQSAVSLLLLACTLSCLSLMTGLCLCVRFKGLLHGRVKLPEPDTEGGRAPNSRASSGNNNSHRNGKLGQQLPTADWRPVGNQDNQSYCSRDAAGSDIYESAAPPASLGDSAPAAAAPASTAARRDRRSVVGRRLGSLRDSFVARLRRPDAPGAATADTGKSTAPSDSASQLPRPRLESQQSVLSSRSHPDRELPPVPPKQQPPLPLPPQPPQPAPHLSAAAAGRSLLKRHLQDFPLPGIAHRLGFGSGRQASSAAASETTPDLPTLAAATTRAAAAGAGGTSPRLPAAASVYTIDSDLTSEIDPLYSAIRRHSGAHDEPATATPTPVSRRRHAVEPSPQQHQQQNVYASICKTLPNSLNNTADSAPASEVGAAAALAELSVSGSAGGQPPPLPDRNYRREEVDRILQEPVAYYSNIDLDAAGADTAAFSHQPQQQQQQPILRPILDDLRREGGAAGGEYQRVTVRESLASLRARNALPLTGGRPASAAANLQRPLHLGAQAAAGGSRAGAAAEDSLYEDLYDAETRGAGLGLGADVAGVGDSYSDLYSEFITDGMRESVSNSLSSLAVAPPRLPPQPSGRFGRSPRDAVRRFSGRQATGFSILNEMQNFRHMDSDVDIAAASMRSSRPQPPLPPQHQRLPPPPPPVQLRPPTLPPPPPLETAAGVVSLGRQVAMTPLMERSIEGSLLDGGSPDYDRLAVSSSDDYSAGVCGGEYASETLRVAALVHRSGRPTSYEHSDSGGAGGSASRPGSAGSGARLRLTSDASLL